VGNIARHMTKNNGEQNQGRTQGGVGVKTPP